MVSLDDVSIFITVVEKQSFSTAARELKISVSAVSKRIARLEHQLKAKLVARSSRRITLTAAGSSFYEKCSGIRLLVDEATRSVRSIYNDAGGSLRVFTSTGLGIRLIAPLIPSFVKKYPNMSVELVIHSGPPTIPPGVDIFIHQEISSEKLLDFRDLGMVGYTICATPHYLETHGRPAVPDALRDHNCLVYIDERGHQTDFWIFGEGKTAYEVEVKGNFFCNSGPALYEAAIKGLGIALLPMYAAFDDIQSGKLVPLFVNEMRWDRMLRGYFSRSEYMPINVRLFLEHVAEHIELMSQSRATARPPRVIAKAPHR
jgi:DNA-binding transcriptional LysR family regulator